MWKPALTREWDLKEASSEQLGCAGLFSADGVITWCWLCSPWGWVPVASPTLAHLSLWSQRGTCNGLGIEESRSVRKNFCGRKIDTFETHSFAWGHRDRKIWRDDGVTVHFIVQRVAFMGVLEGLFAVLSGQQWGGSSQRPGGAVSHTLWPQGPAQSPRGVTGIPRMLQGTFFELSSVLDAWGNHDEWDRNSLCCYRAHGVTGERNINLVLAHVIV